MALRDFFALKLPLRTGDTALAICPDFVEAHISRGLVLKELRRFPEAFASFGKAQAVRPTTPMRIGRKPCCASSPAISSTALRKYEWRQRRHGYPAADFAGRLNGMGWLRCTTRQFCFMATDG